MNKRITLILLVSLVLNKEISFPLDQFRVDPTYLITELLNTKLVTTTAKFFIKLIPRRKKILLNNLYFQLIKNYRIVVTSQGLLGQQTNS
ncbi:hypothetical protein BpHYR1_041323 [Brachionus plicatilis]|uniref:Uncharacterized protein n=1 Tax=Brachionus plicatilis TaxID=10195 RepID=A0A3M7P6N5_BRAPC|nr:hypothetical protein BpHYR1_041323 [Brachionus plicatilis]